jgi:hypothetical protein
VRGADDNSGPWCDPRGAGDSRSRDRIHRINRIKRILPSFIIGYSLLDIGYSLAGVRVAHLSPSPVRFSLLATLFTTAATHCLSVGVRFEPLGRHNPSPKRASQTWPPTRGQSRKTGWRCIGFQSGRDSMFSASRARRTSSRVAPKRAGSITIQVSQRVERNRSGSRKEHHDRMPKASQKVAGGQRRATPGKKADNKPLHRPRMGSQLTFFEGSPTQNAILLLDRVRVEGQGHGT